MIFAGGHISGGHYNPAVTLGVLIRGKTTLAEAVGYWVAQVIAARRGRLVRRVLHEAGHARDAAERRASSGRRSSRSSSSPSPSCYVVLNVATAKGTEGNSFYGLAIGFTVLAGAYAVGWHLRRRRSTRRSPSAGRS